jgi:transglutaminase-like putative cysteine protease
MMDKLITVMKKIFMTLTMVLTMLFALVIGAEAADKYTGTQSEVDATTADKGYISVKYTGKDTKRIKVRVEKGEVQYNYDLNVNGKAEIYSMQLGDGAYKIKVMQNTTENKYAVIQTCEFTVKLESQFAPFLITTQYVNYTGESATVKKAAELAKGMTDPLAKVDAIYKYITELLTYDYDKAKTVASTYLPEVDKILEAKKGICFDYSALMAAMLRSQGIPTKLVTGYVAPSDVYHAWNEVYIEGKGWVKTGNLTFDGKQWKIMDSTFQSSGGSSKEIQKLIGDGTSYSVKYIY